MGEVAEEAAEFRRSVDLETTDRFRRIGGVGPVYEVVSLNGMSARIRMVDTDEAFDYPVADAELDPVA